MAPSFVRPSRFEQQQQHPGSRAELLCEAEASPQPSVRFKGMLMCNHLLAFWMKLSEQCIIYTASVALELRQ